MLPAVEHILPVAAPFQFRDVAFSHGWLRLDPFRWDPDTETLYRVEQLPSGGVTELALSAHPDGVQVRTAAAPDGVPELLRRVRWMLALDEELAPFHALCAAHPGLRAAAERGQGRILRSPTVWEDLVKTLFSVNTTWRQTVSMTRNLVERYGARGAVERVAFPVPAAIARVQPAVLQAECRIGYRAEPLSLLARSLAEGRLDLESLKDPALSAEEVEAQLRGLRGIGPYAAANVLMLLGRYDHLPVDSWFRSTVRKAWFEDREVPDRELIGAFDPFRPYRTLVYRFFDWNGAQGVW